MFGWRGSHIFRGEVSQDDLYSTNADKSGKLIFDPQITTIVQLDSRIRYVFYSKTSLI